MQEEAWFSPTIHGYGSRFTVHVTPTFSSPCFICHTARRFDCSARHIQACDFESQDLVTGSRKVHAAPSRLPRSQSVQAAFFAQQAGILGPACIYIICHPPIQFSFVYFFLFSCLIFLSLTKSTQLTTVTQQSPSTHLDDPVEPLDPLFDTRPKITDRECSVKRAFQRVDDQRESRRHSANMLCPKAATSAQCESFPPKPKQIHSAGLSPSSHLQSSYFTKNQSSTLTSSIITLVVGREQRLFAAHEDVLCISPFFQAACRGQFMEATSKRISLPDEEPEIFSSILEYLYKGDYYPRLVHNKRRNSWEIESGTGGTGSVESTVYHHGVDGELLKDTVIYCTAEKYGLDELKRVALRKQGLRMTSFSCLFLSMSV